jgi:choline dehydrogenase-like flavoprotein
LKAGCIANASSPDFASKDVIISAGSLDSPKILMHSGIGPAAELTKFNIPVIQDVPAIGQGLKDHPFATFVVTRNPETNDRNAFFKSPEAMDAAMEQWKKDGTGPWARYSNQLGVGWFKSDKITSSQEFKALPADVQDFLNRETIPHYELVTGLPLHMQAPALFPDFSYVCLAVFLMNQQSRGEVRLQSSNPDDPLLFDPHFLEHPYDRRACIEMYRHLYEVVEHPAFAKDTIATTMGPASKSDEDILQFWKDHSASSWHMTGTVKMGKAGEKDAAVDNGFRVFGVQGLRVADMSVVPVMTNNHTQATAYVTGATCGGVLIKEYGLDE